MEARNDKPDAKKTDSAKFTVRRHAVIGWARNRIAAMNPTLRLSLFIMICTGTGGLLAALDGIKPRAILLMFLTMATLTALGFGCMFLLQRFKK